jgi:hypothetical protein
MVKILTLITALGLAMTGELRAIGITVEGGQMASSAYLASWYGTSNEKNLTVDSLPASTNTGILRSDDYTSAASAKLGFENTDLRAVFSFSSSLATAIKLNPMTKTGSRAYLNFTLSEDVSYALSGSLVGTLATALPEKDIPAGVGGMSIVLEDSAAGYIYQASQALTNTPGAFSFDASVGRIGTATGTLAAGTYQFYIAEELYYGGSGTGNYSLVLTSLREPEAPPSNSVPDAGSTLGLLGLAMSAIGLVRRMVA